MGKYTFQVGGNNDNGARVFNEYLDNLLPHISQYPKEEDTTDGYEQPVESEYLRSLRSYDEEQQDQMLTPDQVKAQFYTDIEAMLDEKLYNLQQEQDYLGWFSSDDGEEVIKEEYNVNNNSYNPYSTSNYNFTPAKKTNPYNTPANYLNADSYLKAIFGNEGGTLGVDPKNVRGTAKGRFAIIKSGRKELYNKYFKDDMSYQKFEHLYSTNHDFEYSVASLLAMENIEKSKTAAEALGRWYSPAHAESGQWNTVPRPDYGNKLTVRQYVDNAFKNLVK